MLARHHTAGICSSACWLWDTGGSQKDAGMNLEKLCRGMLGWQKSGLVCSFRCLDVHTCTCVCMYVHVLRAMPCRKLSP